MPCELGHVMYETHACLYMIHASCMFHESSMQEWKIICMLILFAWQPLQSIYMAASKKNVAWTPCMPSMVHETCSCMTKKVLYVVGMSLCKHKQPMPWEFGHAMHGTHIHVHAWFMNHACMKASIMQPVFGEVGSWYLLLRALEMMFHMWRRSSMRVILCGRRGIWWGWMVTPVAPRIVNEVSYVMMIK